ncbi:MULTISPECIES: glycosyltransferase family A protein [unclassified Vibrio]|uniref:glycosyltransferase family 2 protein n=1 Tax=unclassified Vibrio TaxID=2614977 RepID=UPI0029649086|nr:MULTISPECIES: glycosyltransferase family A protein [unclassified Vibrio]MDW1579755.1 glycosyltransferase family A protein [Vibrio sp. Vb2897]MDW1585910.1 glycosyltransferase family A protein [Vibrio sp. Vb2910]MDW1594793.1 glycosyltransferase family A protein [Vibrio sp. Vb2911]MDW1638016.1 glycosyltransferase family A protein [Vibrio sp. Vb2896]MDW1648319.1 glycosyltransferase family A protein [Vibrio sp. Vb2912]
MVSVIITTKNRKNFLYRAVESVVANTLKPIDIIIVNDGGDRVEAEQFENSQGIKIDVINNLCSKGGNVARNQGANCARGELLFFLDDDDAFTPTSIASRAKCFENMSVGLAYTGKKLVKSESLDEVYYVSKPKYEGDVIKPLFSLGNVIGTTSCVAVRKSVFESVGGFDEELQALQDYDLWLRISAVCRVKHDHKANLIYTIHSTNNQVSSNYHRYLDAGNYLYNKYKLELNELGLERKFLSLRYLRVAMIASKHSSLERLKYAIISLKYNFSIKGFFMLIPVSISKKIRSFH